LTTLDEGFLAGAPQKKTYAEPTRVIFGPCWLKPSHGLVWRRQIGWPVGLNIWVRYAGLYARQPFLWAQELLDFTKIGFQ